MRSHFQVHHFLWHCGTGAMSADVLQVAHYAVGTSNRGWSLAHVTVCRCDASNIELWPALVTFFTTSMSQSLTSCHCIMRATALMKVHFRDSRTESLSDRLRNCIRCVSELFTQLQLPRNCINAVACIIQFHSGLTDGRPNDPPGDHRVLNRCQTV
jgi:hypothetical protein